MLGGILFLQQRVRILQGAADLPAATSKVLGYRHAPPHPLYAVLEDGTQGFLCAIQEALALLRDGPTKPLYLS